MPPTTQPSDAPLVCIQVNQDWIPYMCGALMQLCQPTTWMASGGALLDVQTSATELIELVGTATVCPMFEMRVSGCNLQFSVDGGSTWITVASWGDFLDICIPAQVGIGVPPNPTGADAATQACNIAAYISLQVIKASINQVVTSITAHEAMLVAVAAIVALIPGADVPLEAIAAGGAVLYGLVNAGTLSDYSYAISDNSLWSEVTCAIYNAIVSTGYVTKANFPTIVSNISALTYLHPAVISTIASYTSGLGAIGLQQLQNIGALNVGDCTGCTGWCYEFDFTTGMQGWALTYSSGLDGHYVPGVGFVGDNDSGEWLCEIQWIPGVSYFPDEECIQYSSGGPGTTTSYNYVVVGGITYNRLWNSIAGSHSECGPLNISPATKFGVRVTSTISGPACVISSVKLSGTGANPIGANNCV